MMGWFLVALVPMLLAGRIARRGGHFAMALERFHSPAECSRAYLSPTGRLLGFHIPTAVLLILALWLMPNWLGGALVLVYVFYQYKAGARNKVLDEVDRQTEELTESGMDGPEAFARANDAIAAVLGWRSTNYKWTWHRRRVDARAGGDDVEPASADVDEIEPGRLRRDSAADPAAENPVYLRDLSPVVILGRQDVEAGVIAPTVGVLQHFIKDAAGLYASRRQVDLAFDGYDDDSRELFSIPEVRSFMAALDRAFPYWFWILRKDTPSLRVVATLLSRTVEVRPGMISIPNEDMTKFMMEHFAALNHLTEAHDIPLALNKEESDAVSQYFGAAEVHN